MTQRITLRAQVPTAAAGQRLDQVAAQMFPEYSRSRIQNWIKSGDLTVADQVKKVNSKVLGGELLNVDAQEDEPGQWQAEAIPLDLIYEDEHVLVLNKPASLVVHPAAGNYSGTLLNGLLEYCPSLQGLPRAGIVHRLDKDTSGLMVVAKTLSAHTSLVAQLQARTVKRQYKALVLGQIAVAGSLTTQFGRDKTNRKKMAVWDSGGKVAITHYEIAERIDDCTLVDVRLETGRTHQIRVHMAHLGHPIVGDPLYGKTPRRKLIGKEAAWAAIAEFERQALHAWQLSLEHPQSGQLMTWQAALPGDFSHLLAALRSA